MLVPAHLLTPPTPRAAAPPRPTAVTRVVLRAGIAVLAAACASDDVTAPPRPGEGVFTVDASTRWAYVSLRDSAVVTPTPSAGESAGWDIAFNATNVMLNGGAAGPGGVTGACVCQNAAAANAELLAMTTASEQADFEAVTAVPAGATFVPEALTPAVAGWFTGTGATAVADPAKAWLVRHGDSLTVSKVRVASIDGATAASAGRVTLEYAVQPAGAAAFGPARTLVVDLTTAGAKHVDLDAGALTTEAPASGAGAWDLRLDGFTVRVNGGVSGPGKGGATPATAGFAGTATATGVPGNAYRTDGYAGVFAAHRYYRYNIGGDNRITPTFDVYLVRRGAAVYKLQVLDYYSTTGQPRHITFRYQQIAG